MSGGGSGFPHGPQPPPTPAKGRIGNVPQPDRFRRNVTLLFLLLTCGAAPAVAHEVGCDGKPVPAAIKEGCCGVADAHALGAGAWRENADGSFTVLVGSEAVTRDIDGAPIRALPSADGCAWGFWRRRDSSTGYYEPDGTGDIRFYCLLLPFTT